MMPPKILLNPGDKLYKYQLDYCIGSGEFGQVWLADDLTISRKVAIKIIDDTLAPIASHLREAQLGNKLTHQNVVKVHYADVVSVSNNINAVIIAMDFHSNGSTLNHLNSANFMPLNKSIQIAVDILRGLEYLHEQNLFHNDIKPSNILLGTKYEGILTDYGISCVSQMLKPAEAPNSYMLHRAPETVKSNQISVLTDIYQVGMTLFRLINGVGFIKEQANRLGLKEFEHFKIQGKVPNQKDYQPFVTRRIKAILNKSVKAIPGERYQSALEMRRALEALSPVGYWTTNSLGSYIGYQNNKIFSFESCEKRNGISFSAFKENSHSGKKVRITSHSANSLSKSEFKVKKQRFMQAVVEGNL